MAAKKSGTELFPERAAEARKAMGFSIAEAANYLGFSNYQTLSAIEKGTRKISANELSSIARLYGRDLGYFFGDTDRLDPIPLWRKSTEYDTKEIQRQFLSFLENYSKMEELLELDRRWKGLQKNYGKTDFIKRGFKLADLLGSEICKFLNLGSRPALNLLSVLENDIRVKILHLPMQDGISAACVVDDNLGVGILINAGDTFGRRSFDIAHELFHIVTWDVFTHEQVGDGIIRTMPERYADAFASSLLLPKKHLLDALDEVTSNKQIRLIDIIELATDFGVSNQALLWRLVNLGVVEKPDVLQALNNPELAEKTRLVRRKQHIKTKPPMFPERFISITCRCLMEGKISRGLFSKYLKVDRDDVDRYLIEKGFKGKGYEKVVASRR